MAMLKSALKNTFSRAFLKGAFLIYNYCKGKTWDKIFFREEYVSEREYLVTVEKNPFLELNIDISNFENLAQEKLRIWNDPKWTQDQYLLQYQQFGFIEPAVGWAISLKRKILYKSLGFGLASYVRKPDFFQMYFKRKKVKKLNKIISMRDTGEENYFHFFNDVLAKIFFLQENGIDLNEYSLVINHNLYRKHYFQFYLNNSFLKNLNWYVQSPHEWIKFDSAIFCKPYTHTKKYFDKAVEMVNQTSTSEGERRIFLTRSTTSFRFIENQDEIDPILRKFNFETIDASDLTFEQQVELFSHCRYLIAVHGAGITNIIFRSGRPLSLIEIVQPSPYIPFHYIMMCKLYKYDYNLILGIKGKNTGSGGFIVRAKDLEEKILRLF